MEEFLASNRGAVLSGSGPVHVVLGNEACDMDSMVCALVYAYFLHKTSAGGALVVPLMNIAAEDLVLRSDSVALLTKTGLSPDLLLFRDQVDLRRLCADRGLRLTLVDHNVLPDSDSDLEEAVVEVIDHHKLERVTSCPVAMEPVTSCPIAVEPVGSCATLVAERVLQRAPQLLDAQIAILLYGTILVDCVDMVPEAGKVTPKDSEVVLQLETKVHTLPQRSQLFTELQQAKFNVRGLNSEQMLLKDLKSLSGPELNLGISVLYLPLQDFLSRPGVEAELSAFCQKMGFDSLLLMSISLTSTQQPIRELGVFSLSQPIREQVSLYLEQAENPALDLQPISCVHLHITAFHQGNSVASRKKLLPMLKDFLWSGQELMVPPTPVNSLVEGCPLDQGLSPTELQTRLSRD
ncbi:exopolyphosphatase PRUNE1 [Periophthalmus magnuspinnatus]|uniref:exopolyphosphatase PRUNE1 n=1 Tax=Periophthalmus magnuspinnatus TaxID=409849 RepID=UPI00145B775A|nr:exopolyphosphatase PRUNE1 [Periophthalmus magnuspinnatus]